MKRKLQISVLGVVLTAIFCLLLTNVAFAAKVPTANKKMTITAGQSKTIKIHGKNLVAKSFTSSNQKIATVNKKGNVKARKEGTCRIKILVQYKKTTSSAKISTKKMECVVHVQKADKDSGSLSTEPSESTISKKEFTKQMADFSIRTFQSTAADAIKNDQNILLSPQSIMMALSMTANGATGDTLSELEKVLYGGNDIKDFNPYLCEYNRQLETSKDVKFYNANSIWMKDSHTAKEDFLQTNQTYYDAMIYPSSFDKTTVDTINQWVKTNTDGMIDHLVDKIPDIAVMYLINAIAFEGNWKDTYNKSAIRENEIFTDSRGNEQKATMLYSKEGEYIKSEDATGFVKPYKGGKYAFMALLPDKNISMADYVAHLSGEKFIDLYENRKTKIVDTRIPEFSYTYSQELKNVLTAMGIQKAFNSDAADFSKMAVLKEGERLYINEVLHKTFIELNRNGTRAAAVTSVEMVAKSSAHPTEKIPEVYLDRPFVYGIINTDTGLPIFIGIVNQIP